MTHTDPAERMRFVREELARQNAKMPRVDHNGWPIAAPEPDAPPTEPAAPERRLPGPPVPAGSEPPDVEAQIREAQARGDWQTVFRLQREQAANAGYGLP